MIEPDVLSREEFSYFKTIIRNLTGIHLTDAKMQLVRSRLRSRLQAHGLQLFSEYRDYLCKLSKEDPEWQIFINCLTTNKTDWFRELPHFDYLERDFLPKWKKTGKELSIWCAACSTGEEPYSIAALLEKELGPNCNYKIKATDIDTEVLSLAQNGVYPKNHLSQIPDVYREDFFSFGTGDVAKWMKVKNRVKNKIHFDQFNLSQKTYPTDKKFDLIFCRNVFIYFDRDMIEHIVQQLYQTASPQAVLFIGHSESLQNIKSPWNYVRPSIFTKGRGF